MKFTKTDNIRVFVSKYKESDERGDFYKTPKPKDDEKVTLEGQIEFRINKANSMYDVFFKADNFSGLQEHFKRIVTRARKFKGLDLQNDLSKYSGYNDKKLSDFSCPVSGNKSLERAMILHVREWMVETWQAEPYKEAAVEILLCICDAKHYEENIKVLPKDTIETFHQACLACDVDSNGFPEVYIKKGENDIDIYFSALIKAMIRSMSKKNSDDIYTLQKGEKEETDKILENWINWMEKCQFIYIGKNKKELKDIQCKWATEDRLQAMLVRARGALKKGTNAKVVVALMQGLAQKDGKTLASVIKEMRKDKDQYDCLKRFIAAVIRNYYHIDALRSIKRTDVKVQPNKNRNEDQVLALANAGKTQKAALNETLVQYASSKGTSDQILRDIKKILFQYFSIKNKDELLTLGKIWQFPAKQAIYFDDDFKEDEKNAEGRDAGCPLEELWESDKPSISQIKNRIKYVNYGKYKAFRDTAKNEFEKYWLKYIKEYVEKNYAGKKRVYRENCYSTAMLSACWNNIIQFLCGKYIDIGKAVYHFAMPDELPQEGEVICGKIKDEYQNGVSSFDYEVIKAEETLQRDISVVTVAAISAFTKAIVDEEKRANINRDGKIADDVLTISDADEPENNNQHVLWEITKKYRNADTGDEIEGKAKDQLLRFYGGKNKFSGSDLDRPETEKGLIRELRSHLESIRNDNYHFLPGGKKDVDTKYTEILWKNEQDLYSDLIKKRYYSNNTGRFYDQEELCNLVKRLYSNDKVPEAQIPSFQRVLRRSDLDEDIKSALHKNKYIPEFIKDTEEQKIFGNAVYFLLKEIYYHGFILDPKAKEYFFTAADNYKKEYGESQSKYAVYNFNQFVFKLKNKGLTFGGICQAVMQEYNQQNSKNGEEKIYQHFKMLFPIYVKNAFILYVQKECAFLEHPELHDVSKEFDFLEEIEIPSIQFPKDDTESAIWFTFAHFIHPRQLNLLSGDFKNYIQYRQDILRRMDCAGELRNSDPAKEKMIADEKAKTSLAQAILQVLEFVHSTAGRIDYHKLDDLYNYYEDKEEYADYLSQYVAFDKSEKESSFESLKKFCKSKLPDGSIIDLYSDEENPKVLHNIELVRMYSGGDLPLNGRDPVTLDEIKKYYKDKPKIEKFIAKGKEKTQSEQKKVVEYQQNKNRLTLNDVTDIYAIVNDLLGQLISLAYLRERDRMYLLLGFYYMAMQSAENWTGEELREAYIPATESASECHIKDGLVLYQIVSTFDYKAKIPRQINGEWTWSKNGKVENIHKNSVGYALRLLVKEYQSDSETKKSDESATALRNYVDHGQYYVKHDMSIIELYNGFYKSFFWYSKKLRDSVVHNFKSVLKGYFVVINLKYEKDEKGNLGFKLLKPDSVKFNYNLEEVINKDSQHEKKKTITCKLDFRDQQFLDELTAILNYKEG